MYANKRQIISKRNSILQLLSMDVGVELFLDNLKRRAVDFNVRTTGYVRMTFTTSLVSSCSTESSEDMLSLEVGGVSSSTGLRQFHEEYCCYFTCYFDINSAS